MAKTILTPDEVLVEENGKTCVDIGSDVTFLDGTATRVIADQTFIDGAPEDVCAKKTVNTKRKVGVGGTDITWPLGEKSQDGTQDLYAPLAICLSNDVGESKTWTDIQAVIPNIPLNDQLGITNCFGDFGDLSFQTTNTGAIRHHVLKHKIYTDYNATYDFVGVRWKVNRTEAMDVLKMDRGAGEFGTFLDRKDGDLEYIEWCYMSELADGDFEHNAEDIGGPLSGNLELTSVNTYRTTATIVAGDWDVISKDSTSTKVIKRGASRLTFDFNGTGQFISENSDWAHRLVITSINDDSIGETGLGSGTPSVSDQLAAEIFSDGASSHIGTSTTPFKYLETRWFTPPNTGFVELNIGAGETTEMDIEGWRVRNAKFSSSDYLYRCLSQRNRTRIANLDIDSTCVAEGVSGRIVWAQGVAGASGVFLAENWEIDIAYTSLGWGYCFYILNVQTVTLRDIRIKTSSYQGFFYVTFGHAGETANITLDKITAYDLYPAQRGVMTTLSSSGTGTTVNVTLTNCILEGKKSYFVNSSQGAGSTLNYTTDYVMVNQLQTSTTYYNGHITQGANSVSRLQETFLQDLPSGAAVDTTEIETVGTTGMWAIAALIDEVTGSYTRGASESASGYDEDTPGGLRTMTAFAPTPSTGVAALSGGYQALTGL